MNQAALPLHQHDVVVLRALEHELLRGASDEVGDDRIHRGAPAFDEDARLPRRDEARPVAPLYQRIAELQLRDALVKRGHRTSFVATGQTGIFIEGWGTAVDAVVADFIAGAAEQLVLQGAKDNDIVLVEGQGSLIHPGYSGVTLGLLHGSCPDALILCHQVTRDYIGDYHGREPWVKIPSYGEMIDIYERAAHPVHPTKVIGICLNTYDMDETAAREAVAKAAEETGLPATDPVRFDSDILVEAIIGARATI